MGTIGKYAVMDFWGESEGKSDKLDVFSYEMRNPIWSVHRVIVCDPWESDELPPSNKSLQRKRGCLYARETVTKLTTSKMDANFRASHHLAIWVNNILCQLRRTKFIALRRSGAEIPISINVRVNRPETDYSAGLLIANVTGKRNHR